jgi:lipopolysaccharide transport system ATP-binding protein
MSDTVISIENVSKLYRLGTVGTKSLQGDIKRWWATIRGKEDPYAMIGTSNTLSSKSNSEYVWALKDINLEIKQGDVVGIIGKNGAGKSTLLKILSRVTTPTTGKISINGRVASLLEVGTGFHPELTGRENIFLNGSILGMKKAEIRSKFDEIVDFSGVEKYIDTPVKRYSSGMYVRLAFAVAAHLEPEILIIDEVLAVGDAEFQKKALGKMQDVSSGQGRTVLFVSHNIDAVKQICKSGILIQEGTIAYMSDSKSVAERYLSGYSSAYRNYFLDLTQSQKGDGKVTVLGIDIIDTQLQQTEVVSIDKAFGVKVRFSVAEKLSPVVNLELFSFDKKYIASSISTEMADKGDGIYEAIVWIAPNILNNINYYLGIGIMSINSLDDGTFISSSIHFYNDTLIQIKPNDSLLSPTRNFYKGNYGTLIRPVFTWDILKL